jgi:hypothetical protein
VDGAIPNLQLHDLELAVVHLGDHLGLPVLGEQAEFLSEIDRLVFHANAS